MKCPACGRTFSYLYSFRVLNSFRHKCPDCKNIITTGNRGAIVAITGAFAGIAIAAVAIVMEERHLWTTADSLRWFAIAGLVAVPAFNYIWWKWCPFTLKRPPSAGVSRIYRYIFCFFVLVAVWIAFAVLVDERIDPDVDAFYTRPPVANEENAAIALAGLSAPIGEDFMKFGLAKVEADTQAIRDHNYLPATKGPVTFAGHPEELYCWVKLPQSSDSSQAQCASEQRLKTLIQENAVLLARYRQARLLPHLSGMWSNAGLLLNLNWLIAAEVELNIRQRHFEAAYQQWRDNYQFISRMIGEDGSWIDKAIFMTAEKVGLVAIESLIHSYPDLAVKHKDELHRLLKPAGLNRWNLPGVMRAEYLMFDPILAPGTTKFWVHRNFIRNHFYRSALAVLSTATLPPAIVKDKIEQVLAECCDVRKWSNDYWRDPMNAGFFRLIGGGQIKSVELIAVMWDRDGELRALNLALKIKTQKIPDNSIENFLADTGPELKNPYTNLPMIWDPAKRVIRFDSLRQKSGFEVRL